MKVAVIHEMLIKLWGAENVTLDILEMFPDADLYTLIYDEKKVWSKFPPSRIKHVPKITQRVYNLIKNQRFTLPFMARAIESIDFSSYDLVIASSSAFAHWCITKPETCFVAYYHSPSRYIWDYTFEHRRDMNYRSLFKKPLLLFLSIVFQKLRIWDYLAWQRHDVAIAASKQVQQRIAKYYRRESELVYPGVYVNDFEIGENPLKERDHYVILSALTEFKKVDVSVKAFTKMWHKLKIVGEWAQRSYLESIAWPNIEFVWYKDHEKLKEIYKEARGFIMSWRDDYGIAPIEAMAAWMPVFALNQGWLVETNVAWLSWEFFDDPEGKDFIPKFERFHADIEEGKFDRIKIRNHALKFRKERFIAEFRQTLDKYLN
ncbi:MAG: glycosyl transferase group 1 [uncultured bacterium (gcode 4)]|uniref:Glycosyl transferase group 1 n=1 Tax=uncultured bacterium (gcode 4) TaxID=1234023 RepID=K2G3A0_9BACT|nr:MAG: glycosyl transferase group 1 [uncultured bacterium (gcode 4)]